MLSIFKERDGKTIIGNELRNLGWSDEPIQSEICNVFKQRVKTKEQEKLLQNKRPDYILYGNRWEKLKEKICRVAEYRLVLLPTQLYWCEQAISEGYEKRFSVVHCNYQTMKRTPKDSFYFYRDLTIVLIDNMRTALYTWIKKSSLVHFYLKWYSTAPYFVL